jgi:hypothetical protein
MGFDAFFSLMHSLLFLSTFLFSFILHLTRLRWMFLLLLILILLVVPIRMMTGVCWFLSPGRLC